MHKMVSIASLKCLQIKEAHFIDSMLKDKACKTIIKATVTYGVDSRVVSGIGHYVRNQEIQRETKEQW